MGNDKRDNNIERSKSYKIIDVIKKLKSIDYEIIGDSNISFSKASTIFDAEIGSITFCSEKKISNPINVINKSKASVIIAKKGIDTNKINTQNKAIVVVDNPRGFIIKILNLCFPPEKKIGKIHYSSEIDDDAIIHKSVYIGPNCVIRKCKIKANSIIHSNTVINDNVTIGENVVVFPGCIIGFDGFGYNRNKDGTVEKFIHFGGVVIEDNVDIYSNVVIVRGVLGDTIIKKGAKIGNFCNIGHNVIIGKNVLTAAYDLIAGSTEIGDNSYIAPSVVIRNGIFIGENSKIGMGSVVTKNVPKNIVVVGNPAMPFEDFKKIQKNLRQSLL